jgi:hypothetical protein
MRDETSDEEQALVKLSAYLQPDRHVTMLLHVEITGSTGLMPPMANKRFIPSTALVMFSCT